MLAVPRIATIFNPSVANLADLNDDDRHYRNYRKFFVAAFVSFILASYSVPNPPAIAIPVMYLQFALYMLIGTGVTC